MNSKFSKETAFGMLLLLVTMCFLAGCQSILKTQTAATSDAHITAGVCSVWKPISYSSKDTAETTLQVRAGNAANAAYCKPR